MWICATVGTKVHFMIMFPTLPKVNKRCLLAAGCHGDEDVMPYSGGELGSRRRILPVVRQWDILEARQQTHSLNYHIMHAHVACCILAV